MEGVVFVVILFEAQLRYSRLAYSPQVDDLELQMAIFNANDSQDY